MNPTTIRAFWDELEKIAVPAGVLRSLAETEQHTKIRQMLNAEGQATSLHPSDPLHPANRGQAYSNVSGMQKALNPDAPASYRPATPMGDSQVQMIAQSSPEGTRSMKRPAAAGAGTSLPQAARPPPGSVTPGGTRVVSRPSQQPPALPAQPAARPTVQPAAQVRPPPLPPKPPALSVKPPPLPKPQAAAGGLGRAVKTVGKVMSKVVR